jgi:lytic cellulose monooxygenase (C1-hydroxylating)
MEALHSSTKLGETQFYVGCAQLKITGTGAAGSCGPSIQLPGAYKPSDSNIFISNFYYGFEPAPFRAPGGPVASCHAGGGAMGASTPMTAATLPEDSTPEPVMSPEATTTTPQIATAAETAADESTITAATAVKAAGEAGGPVPLYGRCGGQGYSGPKECASGACVEQNQYYWQCV